MKFCGHLIDIIRNIIYQKAIYNSFSKMHAKFHLPSSSSVTLKMLSSLGAMISNFKMNLTLVQLCVIPKLID